MWNILSVYPIATVSTAAFYLLLLALAVPASRQLIAPWFTHPIPVHQGYLRGFDTLRGLAAAFVAICHCWWMTYPVFASSQLAVPLLEFGSKGVPVFAALSGFLIYRSVLSISSLEKFRDYAVRRFFRIYPVYLLGVVLCIFTGQYVEGSNFSAASMLASDLFMFPAINWPDGFANPPTWSLYIEIVFYCMLPVAVLVLRQKRMIAASIILIIAMIVADNPNRVFSLWKYFFVGILASEIAKFLKAKEAFPLFAFGLVLFAIDMNGPKFDWGSRVGIGVFHPDGQTIGLLLACGFILAALPSLSKIGAALNILPLRVLGVISYSVYITQFFYIQANFPEIVHFSQANTPAMTKHFQTVSSFAGWYLPLVFFPGLLFWGAVSFLLIESPGMRLGKWLIDRGRALPDAATVAAE